MRLLLDGTPLSGRNPKVSVNQQIERNDLSGTSSASTSTHKGWKPATITYTCQVAFEEADHLTQLQDHWLSQEDKQPRIHGLEHPLLRAMGILKGQFADQFSITPNDTLKLWEVRMTLLEVRSRAERTEEAPVGTQEKSTTNNQGTRKDKQDAGTSEKSPPPEIPEWIKTAENWAKNATGDFLMPSEKKN